MKLQLIIQCIDTFGFKSPKDKLYFFINGNPIETIHKAVSYTHLTLPTN